MNHPDMETTMATGVEFIRKCPTCRHAITMEGVARDAFLICPECAATLMLNTLGGIWLRVVNDDELADLPGYELIHAIRQLQYLVRRRRNAA